MYRGCDSRDEGSVDAVEKVLVSQAKYEVHVEGRWGRCPTLDNTGVGELGRGFITAAESDHNFWSRGEGPRIRRSKLAPDVRDEFDERKTLLIVP